MNWLDRTIAAVAPRTGLKRAAARAALRHVETLGKPRKRYATESDRDWNVNTGTRRGAMPLQRYERQRIRRMIASNPHAVKAMQTLQNNLIGFGITGTPEKAPKRLTEAWKAWQKQADYMRQLDFFGLQDLAVSTMVGDGEAYIVRRFEKGAVVPTRLQVLDGDMLAKGLGNGANGIDYDAVGRPMKYHFRPSRGIMPSVTIANVVSFDAKDVIHLFRREFVGQLHGRSMFEPVLKALTDLNDYYEAEIVRKKIEACFVAFVTPSAEVALEGNGVMGAETGEQTLLGNDIEAFEPGMVERLAAGDEVTFGEPKATQGIKDFTRVQLLAATAGVGVPYEHGTGDLSNVNYSSYKAGSLEFQRFCGRLQWLLIIPTFLDRVWQWFLEDGYQTGQFARPDYAIGWTPAEFESIDRKKDADGIAAEMAMGLTSRRRLVGERGYNYEQEMQQIAADAAFEAELGLDFSRHPEAAPAESEPKRENGGD